MGLKRSAPLTPEQRDYRKAFDKALKLKKKLEAKESKQKNPARKSLKNWTKAKAVRIRNGKLEILR